MKETIVGGKTLKVKFTQDGAVVTVQVLEQDESLRNKGEIIWRAGYSISSISYPAIAIGIGANKLYVRGTEKNRDNILDKWSFGTEEKATAYINSISKLIQEINGNTEEYEKMNKSIIIRTDGFKVVTATLYDKSGEQIRKEKAKCSPEDTYDFETGAMLALERLIEKSSEKIIVGDETLKVEFTRHGREVTAKVLEMDESMRGNYAVMEGNGYKIQSIMHPQITSTALIIRGGAKSRDHIEPKYEFDSVMEAKKYIKNISELIGEINAEHKWNAKVVCVKTFGENFKKGKIYDVKNGKIRPEHGVWVGNYSTFGEMKKSIKSAKFIEIVD